MLRMIRIALTVWVFGGEMRPKERALRIVTTKWNNKHMSEWWINDDTTTRTWSVATPSSGK